MTYDHPTHNYMRKIEQLKREGGMPPAGFYVLEVLHDDWCDVLRNPNARCNCDPEIRFSDQWPTGKHTNQWPPRPKETSHDD